ncbi:lytic transglycosylase domain-containing protein [Salmonella enterica]|nr:lytic transglycosylase domain-containing protein [Salmonella enterica]
MAVLRNALLLLALSLGLTAQAHAWCFSEAGQRYHIDPLLLRAIAIQESELNPRAVGVNRDKKGNATSRDYGLMQINDANANRLISMGVIHSHQELLNNACLNVQAGAWVLARHFQVCGITWDCLGSYNAGFQDKNAPIRQRYARQVYTIYQRLRGVG